MKRRRTPSIIALAVVSLVLVAAGLAVVFLGPETESGGSQAGTTVSQAGATVSTAPTSAAQEGSQNHAVQLVQSEVFRAAWGRGASEVGRVRGEARGPSSFVVDDEEQIHILDGVNGRILLVCSDGSCQQIKIAAATDPYDLAIAQDGSYVIYDAGTASFQSYSAGGVALASVKYPEQFYPAFLCRAGGTVYVSAGWEGALPGFGFVPIFDVGRLLPINVDEISSRDAQPLETCDLRVATGEDGRKQVELIENGRVLFSATLSPTPSGPVYANRLTDGRLVIAADVQSDPESLDTVLKHLVWVFDTEGNCSSYDLGAEDTRVGYIHVEARVTPKGSVYFLNTKSAGLTIWKTSL